MKHIMKKRDTRSYYVSNADRSVSITRKIMRFIMRYIVPTLYIVLSLSIVIFLILKLGFADNGMIDMKKSILIFVISSLVLGGISSILGGKWFTYISSIEDK